MMELLDLPTWMKLTQATCNKVSAKIQWTKLKSQPISLLSRVRVQSVAPNWKPCNDLGPTKIRDSERGEILLFKEVDWQTTRIEATAVEGESLESFTSTPLRLIANQCKLRITIKKRLSDCGIIATRLMLLLDDLLWVLTDSQLKAAILYVNSLKGMMEKSRSQSKNQAAEKLHGQSSEERAAQQQHEQQQQQNARARSQSNTHIANLFSRFDVPTTTYHVITSRIDLHLCDDSTPGSNKHPDHNSLIEGGAMQITLNKLSIDIYPYNRAGGERKHWYRYMDNQGSRNMWVQQLFADFKADATRARDTCHIPSPSQSPSHKPQQKIPANQNAPNKQAPPRPPPPASHPTSSQNTNSSKKPRPTKLLESCYVFKLEDFAIYQVSTADNKRNTPKKFLASDKKTLHLPADMSVIHAEFTDYFFPEGVNFPVPHANLYILLNPTRLYIDWLTMLWANYFSLSLSQSVSKLEMEEPVPEHLDIKIEAIMPRVIVPIDEKFESQSEHQEAIQLQISRLMATNTHVEGDSKTDVMAGALDNYSCAELFNSQAFPNDQNKIQAIPNNYAMHVSGIENPYLEKKAKELVEGKFTGSSIEELDELQNIWRTNTLKKDSRYDIWCIKAEQVWLEFVELGTKNRPQPFVDSIPLTLWICRPFDDENGKRERSERSRKEESEVKKMPLKRLYDQGKCSKVGEESHRENRRSRRLLKDFYSDEKDSFEESNVQQRSQENCDNSESGAKVNNGGCQGTGIEQTFLSQVATINILAKIGQGCVKVQITHFQYLFLMRLLDSFTTFQSQMNADMEFFIGGVQSPSLTFSIPLLVPEFEVVMVIPEVTELPPPESTRSPSIISSKDELEEEKEKDEAVFPADSTCNEDKAMETTTLDHSPVEDSRDRSVSVLDLLPASSAHLSHSQSDSRIPALTVEGQPYINENGFPPTASSQSSCTLKEVDSVTLAQSSVTISHNSDSGISSILDTEKARQASRKPVGKSAADQMSKFKLKMTGFADKLKAKMEIGDDKHLDIEDYDNISIRTDTSEEDMDFELLSLEEDGPIFQRKRDSETNSVSTDTDLMEDSSSYADSSVVTKGKEMVSVIAFKLCGIELLLSSDGSQTTASTQAMRLLTSQYRHMQYDDLQRKFSSNTVSLTAFCSEEGSSLSTTHTVKTKFTAGSDSTVEDGHSTNTLLQVKARDFGLKFTTTSLTNLTSFIEDELQGGPPMCMNIQVQDFNLILEDDTVVQGRTQTPQPVNLEIHRLGISRGQDGIFHLIGEDPESLAEADLMKEIKALKLKNKSLSDELKSVEIRTKSVDSLEEENHSLKEQLKKFADCNMTDEDNVKSVEVLMKENVRFLTKVTELEDEVSSLKKEKDSLLETMRLLQDELNASENQRLRSNSRNTHS
ncbi:hypothetical protein FSP39_024532 [Pinctada imbricata]|uniref:UHRF1-binding protein 1-like n=1 Tax=Pinctada imbricata TaxID=66713 RepID=A0AA89C7J6_PINIB|nr:hypothetical protein FSP39_024532 [Pinctada imbricata]